MSQVMRYSGGVFMSPDIKKIRNSQIQRIIIGVPLEHKHLRAVIELTDGMQLILHEATLASLTRAFMTTKLDPIRSAVELEGKELVEQREDFASYQLLETNKCSGTVRQEITQILTLK